MGYPNACAGWLSCDFRLCAGSWDSQSVMYSTVAVVTNKEFKNIMVED